MKGRPYAILSERELAQAMSQMAGELRILAPTLSDFCFEAAIRLQMRPGPTAASVGYLVREELRRLGIDPDLRDAEAVDLADLAGRTLGAVLPLRTRPRA